MDTALTRKLARIQCSLHMLGTQRDALTELADIKEFRALESSFRETLSSALAKGLVPSDPANKVRADWLRIIKWSNEIQSAIIEATEAGDEVDIFIKKGVSVCSLNSAVGLKKWNHGLSSINKLNSKIEAASENIKKVLRSGSDQIVSEDWINNRPYQELTDLAEAYSWKEFVEQTELPENRSEKLGKIERPLVSSWMAIQPDCVTIKNLLDQLNRRHTQVEELQKTHKKHSKVLGEIDSLIVLNKLDDARDLLQKTVPIFSDIDYDNRHHKIINQISNEKTIRRLEADSLEVIDSVVYLWIKLSKAFIINRWTVKPRFEEALENLLKNVSIFTKHLKDGLKGNYSQEQSNRLSDRLKTLLRINEILNDISKYPDASKMLTELSVNASNKTNNTWADLDAKIAKAAEKRFS